MQFTRAIFLIHILIHISCELSAQWWKKNNYKTLVSSFPITHQIDICDMTRYYIDIIIIII